MADEKPKGKRRKMMRFSMSEISAVDEPAQKGALAVIMKRKPVTIPTDLRIVKHYLESGSFAVPAHAVIAKGLSVEKSGASWPYLAALETSLHSIVADTNLADTDKVNMMKSSVGEFLQTMKRQLPDVESNLIKVLASIEDDDMNLRQLQKNMSSLGRKLDSVISRLDVKKDDTSKGGAETDAAGRLRDMLGTEKAEDDMEMPFVETEKDADPDYMEEAVKADDEYMVGDSETEKQDEEPENEKPTSQGEEEEPIAAGSTRPIGGKRMHKGADYEDNDEDFIKLAGHEFHKNDLTKGDLFTVLKMQQEQIDQLTKHASSQNERSELLEFGKVADEQLASLPGTSDQKARVLRSLSKSLDKDDRKLLSKMLVAGDRALSSAFRTVGHGDGSFSKARTGFTKRVDEIRSRDNCSRTVAMQKARREYPDEFADFQDN